MVNLGRTVVILGLVLAAIGLVLMISPKIPWLGKLPGDLYIKKENFSFYFPITTSIILSVIISVILYFIRKGK